jgi:hypothetical protein
MINRHGASELLFISLKPIEASIYNICCCFTSKTMKDKIYKIVVFQLPYMGLELAVSHYEKKCRGS